MRQPPRAPPGGRVGVETAHRLLGGSVDAPAAPTHSGGYVDEPTAPTRSGWAVWGTDRFDPLR